MTQGEKQKFLEAMKVCSEAATRASQRGENFNSSQAIVYTTISLTLYWAMAVLGEETQHNVMYRNFEQLIANAKQFGCGLPILPDDYRG